MISRILFLLLIPWVAFGATPAYEKFKGAGTVTITTNPPNGDVTITGGGASLTQVTNIANVTVTNLTPSVVAAAAASNALYEPKFIVVDGDSISTTNYVGPGLGWVDMLRTNSPWSAYSYTNTATDFRTISNVSLNFPVRGGSIGIVSNTAPQWMCFMPWAGLNDLVNGHGTNTVIADLSNTWRQARSSGYQVCAFTIAQSSYDYYASNSPIAAFTTNRWAVNNWIRGPARTARLYDTLIDVETALTNAICEWNIFDNDCGTLKQLDTIDGVHLSTTGNLKVASCVLTSMVRHAVQPLGVLGGTVRGKVLATETVEAFGGFRGGLLSWFTNAIAIPGFGSTVGYKWTCTNATTGEGHWDDGLLLDASESDFYILAEGSGTMIISNSSRGVLMKFDASLPTSFWQIPIEAIFTAPVTISNQVVAAQYLTPYSTSDFIPTNNALSNLTINFVTGPAKRDLYITNNVTLTNIVPPGLGTNGSITLRITPQLIPRGLLLPTLGGNQFGVKIHTNANNPIWTTLTNGVSYRLVMEAWGTNIDVAISEWK